MARQARSEVTRRTIITSAVELFNEIGYSAAGLGDIIDRTQLTKGALYYHFDSKEALANAIIEEAGTRMRQAFRSATAPSAPALENFIHGVLAVADLMRTDEIARSGNHLLRALGEFNGLTARTYSEWLSEMTSLSRQAIEEGDVRGDADPTTIGETVLAATLGAELLSQAIADEGGAMARVFRMWQLLLPAIVAEDSLGYFREFLARESLRSAQGSSTHSRSVTS